MATISDKRRDRAQELMQLENKPLLDLATELVVANRFVDSVYDFYCKRGYISNKQKMAIISIVINEELPLRSW